MFDDSFSRVVIAYTNGDADISDGFPVCGRAQGDYNTRHAALCYCLCYQRMHFESLGQIYATGELDAYDSPLIIDVGSGPATVPLALAQRHAEVLQRGPLQLRYFDIERGAEMRRIADQYLADPELFHDLRRHSIVDIAELNSDCVAILQEYAKASDCILVAMSYVLKQVSVDVPFAEFCAKLAIWCAEKLKLPTYVLIQDKSAAPFDRYDAFESALAMSSYRVVGGERRVTQAHRQVRPDGTPTSQGAPPNGNVVYKFGRLEIY